MKDIFNYIVLFLSLFIIGFFSSASGKDNKISYRIIYIIHGDGDYLFHDRNSNAHEADERILKQAIDVAENSIEGEVFIFHQKEKENFLFFFPIDDGEFFYYKKGKLIEEGSFSREDAEGFEIESDIFSKLSEPSSLNNINNFFLYYGHEIPEEEKIGYHLSHPEKVFDINKAVEGIKSFTNSSVFYKGKFDLIVLSTCNNGTPDVISALSPFADYLIASPADLHLSHMNSELLKKLDEKNNLNVYEFAKDFAEYSYSKLCEATNTVVAISLYDLEKSVQFLSKINENNLFYFLESTDNNILNCFNGIDRNLNPGVETFYRPPLFGKGKDKNYHSGWGRLDFEE